MSNTLNYLKQRADNVGFLKDEMKQHANFANPEDVWAFKDLSLQSKAVQEIIKQELNLDHDMKKRILDSFQ
ncbi:hypothetical protein TDB9533_00041 [Thalassocella blandensis]|nr:hypothetical protein TDB9533_00041 [Thalassocella blandensis]